MMGTLGKLVKYILLQLIKAAPSFPFQPRL